jgi:peptidoglycan/xylan/chitin deacetylase (PgdA/CDA1 family)
VRLRDVKKIRRVARRLLGQMVNGPLILMYHRVVVTDVDPWSMAVTPESFDAHLDVLSHDAHLVRLSDLAEFAGTAELPPRSVALTFDDGYADNMEAAAPIMERYGAPATLFLVTGRKADAVFWWDELERILLQPGDLPPVLEWEFEGTRRRISLGNDAVYSNADAHRHRGWRAFEDKPPTNRHRIFVKLYPRLKTMPEDERAARLDTLRNWAGLGADGREQYRRLSENSIRELARGGRMELGSHTVTHPVLSALPEETQRREIENSKRWLDNITGRGVNGFAYPHGSPDTYTPRTVELVREAGYSYACVAHPGLIHASVNRFKLPRIEVRDLSKDRFARYLCDWFCDPR